MKKIVILIFSVFFMLGAGNLFAQKERIEYLPNFDSHTLRFGFYLGLNQIGYKVAYKDPNSYNPIPPVNKELFVDVDDGMGFNIGFIVDLRLNDYLHLHLEPGLMSSSTTMNFLNANIGPENPEYNGTMKTDREVTGTYMHVPLLLKFSTKRLNNLKPFLIGGVSYDYNFSSKENSKDDNYNGQFRMTTHNFMYEVGVGMDFYFYFFKFSPSIRGIFAINNQMVNDFNPDSPWTAPIDFFGTRGIFLNLSFQ